MTLGISDSKEQRCDRTSNLFKINEIKKLLNLIKKMYYEVSNNINLMIHKEQIEHSVKIGDYVVFHLYSGRTVTGFYNGIDSMNTIELITNEKGERISRSFFSSDEIDVVTVFETLTSIKGNENDSSEND